MTATTTERPARPRRDRPGVRICGDDDAEMGLAPTIDRTADAKLRFGDDSVESLPPLTTQQIAEIEARGRASVDHWERAYRGLKIDALSCARAMAPSPLLGAEKAWTDVVSRSLDDYRSGRSLMDHMGADRLIDPALTGMLLAIRRGLLEEIHSPTMTDFVLTDMAVIAFANLMRVQSIVGNTALIIESELFGQPTLRGGRPEDRYNLAVDEYVVRLRETLMPLVEKFNRMGNEAIGALRRQQEAPSVLVERARPLEFRLISAVTPGD